MESQVPQLRIEVNSQCEKACRYCRPTGEGVQRVPRREELSAVEMGQIVALVASAGIRHLKLTGGDPGVRQVARGDIPELARRLKDTPGIETLDMVTRHPKLGEIASQLAEAGVDLLKFSLDSLEPNVWEWITRSKGHANLIAGIKSARGAIPIRINMVVMKNVNDREVPAMIDFAASIGAELKLLELIRDVGDDDESIQFNWDHYFDVTTIMKELELHAIAARTVTQAGGLGHPMLQLTLPNGCLVTAKSLRAGAFYSPSLCRKCPFFPCDDAIMALRLTPEGKLQTCLLRSDNLLDVHGMLRAGLQKEEIVAKIDSLLDIYRNAVLMPWNVLEPIRCFTNPTNGLRTISARVDVTVQKLAGASR